MSWRNISITFCIALGTVAVSLLLAGLQSGYLQAARSASPDPEITQITIKGDGITLYDPEPDTGISRTVYFQPPVLPSSLVLTMSISGTAPLTFTAGAAFDQNAVRTLTSITAPWVQPVTYTVPALSGDYPNVPYVVTNTQQTSYQVNLSFIKDAIPPTAVITSPQSSPATTFLVSWNGNDVGSGVASYDIDYKENNGSWQPWLTGITTTTAVFAGQREITYTLRVKANDNVGNPSSYATSATFIEPAKVYLPFVSSSIPVPQVTWSSPSQRSMGITTFARTILLTLAASSQPDEMKVWQGNNEPPLGWVPFNSSKEFSLTGSNGLNNINVRFRWGTVESVISTVSVFFLENGDFRDGINTGWDVTPGGLPEAIVNNNLRLGADNYNCYNGVPFNTLARAELSLSVPSTPGYKLHFEYVVHTQDKLGGTNNGLYDSFDVYVNSSSNPPNILRTGNATQPATCSGSYNVDSPEGGFSYLLNNYAGQFITVSFENWSRYDGYYNTYTDLKKVWVEKAP